MSDKVSGISAADRAYAAGLEGGWEPTVVPPMEVVATSAAPSPQDQANTSALKSKLSSFGAAFAPEEGEKREPAGSLYKKIKAQTDLGLGPTPGPREIK